MKRLTVPSVMAGLIALLLGNGLAFSQELPPGPTVVYRATLPGLTLSGEFDLDIHINDFAPGASTPLRTHSGPRLSTLLEGEMSRTFEDGKVERFKVGENWAEMPGEYSVTGNEGTVPARVSSSLLVPKGQSPATPKPGSRPPQIRPTSIYSSTLSGITQPGEFDLVLLTLDFAPGSATPLHTHGGPGLVLVLEGEISNAVEGKPEQIVKTGQSWPEMPGEYAVVGNKGAAKARVVFAVVLPKGAPLTTVKQQSPEQVARAFTNAYNAGDLNAMSALVAPGTRFIGDPGTPAAYDLSLDEFAQLGKGVTVSILNANQTAPDTVVLNITLQGGVIPPLPHPYASTVTITVENGRITSFVEITSAQTRADLEVLEALPGMPTTGAGNLNGVVLLLVLGLLCLALGRHFHVSHAGRNR